MAARLRSSRDRAVDLAKRGVFVFPVDKNKKPITKKGDFSDERWSASADLATVHFMFNKFPDADIGIATGESQLVVIDVDVKSGGMKWYEEHKHELRCGYIVRTRSGGRHLYYRADPDRDVRDSAGVIAPGVDVRGEGGYVVAYTDIELGTWPSDAAKLPEALHLSATKGERKSNVLKVDFRNAHPSQGERSDKLIKIGGALVARGKAWKVVERLVRKEADLCQPPFDEDELEKTVLKSLRTYYDEEHAPRPPRKIRTAAAEAIDDSEDRILIPAEQLWAQQELPAQLVEGILEQQTECSLIGPTGAAKSLIALELSLAIATGKRFFGHKCQQGPVLYLCGEGAGGIRRRFQALALDRGIEPRGIPFAVLPKAFDMEGPDIEDALDEFEARYSAPPVAVVIDTYSRYVGRENDENASGDLYTFFAAVAEVFGGIARIIVHHTGHGDAKRSRGTSAWNQAVDTEFVISVEDDPPTFESVRTMENTKQKDGELGEPKYFKLKKVVTRTRREGKLLWSVVLEETEPPEDAKQPAKGGAMGANQKTVLAMIEANDGATRAEIIAKLKKGGMEPNRISEAISALRKQHKRIKMDERGCLWVRE